jgi:beta-glucosidase
MDNNRRLNSLISQMTLDEKLAQLGSYWIFELQTQGELDQSKVACKLKHGIGQITRVAGASTLDPVSAAKAANHLQKFLVEETRLGIPAILHEESCCGAMVLGGSMFPQMLGLAATFQPELAQAMTAAIREQLLAIGARQALAPVLDIARDPRWGRVEETFGEDPTLASHFGVAYIKGLQGDSSPDGLAQGVLATGKHFIGHSFSQGGLNCAPVHMGWQEIYEVCMAPFQAAIREAGLGSIMNAYPELDGEVIAASQRILTDILRHELGFDGLVVSDYQAVIMIHNFHHRAADLSAAAVLALEAGIDVELPTVVCYSDPLRAALEAGEINLETIDQSVRRHLEKKIELNLFERPYVDEERVLEVFETQQNRMLACEIARQSMVLLKNDGSLPLEKTIDSIAVIGPSAHDRRNLLGDYSYAATKEYLRGLGLSDSSFVDVDKTRIDAHDIRITTVLDGIREAAAEGTQVLYARGCEILGDDRSGFEEAVRIAQQAEVVVLVLGDRSGLTPECTTGETRDSADLRLPGVQENLARAIIGTGKPVVVVLINGRPYAIPWLAENANAILEAWLPGEEGGAAIADVLFGEINPGGKLPITFPRSIGQLPIFYSTKTSGKGSHWYEDYVAESAKPLYPFGYGLSYTDFEYKDLLIQREAATAGESVDISFTLTNTGRVAGDEVVQLYIRDEIASVPRPAKELKGFARVRLLPGESKMVTFHLPVNQLALYDHDLNLVLEAGKITIMLGSSSEDIRLTGELEITGAGNMLVKERVFFCPVDILQG